MMKLEWTSLSSNTGNGDLFLNFYNCKGLHVLEEGIGALPRKSCA